MKRPAFQFYPADWRNNAKLRRCSEAARGAWIDVLCLMHDSDEYGVLRWPLADIARAAGLPLKLLKELVEKGVLKGTEKGESEPYIFTPRHAGKDGDPVVLIEPCNGPIWYCSRFVRDEYIRRKRGQSTRFDDTNNPKKSPPKEPPKPPIGDGEGYGPSSTSTSSIKPKHISVAGAVGNLGDIPREPPDDLPPPENHPFPMSASWRPDENLTGDMLRIGGVDPSVWSTPTALAEFISHWSTTPDVITHAEWNHRYVKNILANARRSRSRPATASKHDLAQMDYQSGVQTDGSF